MDPHLPSLVGVERADHRVAQLVHPFREVEGSRARDAWRSKNFIVLSSTAKSVRYLHGCGGPQPLAGKQGRPLPLPDSGLGGGLLRLLRAGYPGFETPGGYSEGWNASLAFSIGGVALAA